MLEREGVVWVNFRTYNSLLRSSALSSGNEESLVKWLASLPLVINLAIGMKVLWKHYLIGGVGTQNIYLASEDAALCERQSRSHFSW
jgi:hypothetical protein